MEELLPYALAFIVFQLSIIGLNIIDASAALQRIAEEMESEWEITDQEVEFFQAITAHLKRIADAEDRRG